MSRSGTTIVLTLLAAGIFLIECAIFHFPATTGLDVLWLAGLTVVPGVLGLPVLRRVFALELSAHEIVSLGSAVGFGIVPIERSAFHFLGIDSIAILYYGVGAIVMGTVAFLVRRKPRITLPDKLRAVNDLWIFAIGILLFFAAYNLQQFHYSSDGSIVTHGLFGVDLPFLAGEIHGLRDFGALRDLHQMGQPWHYHDWTYQLLALLPAERTLDNLVLAAPLLGYTVLTFSIFTLALQITNSKYIAYVSTAVWFLVSSLEGGELSSYALSPSFVFGTVIFLNVLLALDRCLKANQQKSQWVFFVLIVYLLGELSQTKLSSFLVLAGGIGLLGLKELTRSKDRTMGIQLILALLLPMGIVFWQNASPNLLMPGGDFLMGAPLLGYANHLATILHIPVSGINPVSHGLLLNWRSLLIIPFFVFHFLRFAFLDPKILSGIIVLVVLRKFLFQESKEMVLLLAFLIPLGFLLPALYSPAWYPLALSFYAPLVSAQSALLITTIGFGMLARMPRTSDNSQRMVRTALGVVGLIVLAGVALNVRTVLMVDSSKPEIVSASFVHAMDYLQINTADSIVIASRRFDLDSTGDESYYWYGALSGRTIISEGAKYGSLLAAIADTNAEKGLHRSIRAVQVLQKHRSWLDTIYCSKDSNQVRNALKVSRSRYFIQSGYPGERLSIDPAMTADRVFNNEGYEIWKNR